MHQVLAQCFYLHYNDQPKSFRGGSKVNMFIISKICLKVFKSLKDKKTTVQKLKIVSLFNLRRAKTPESKLTKTSNFRKIHIKNSYDKK